MITSVAQLLGEERPEWQREAACRGMLKAFTGASLDEQVAVCQGTTSPWSRPCPVAAQCLESFVERALFVTGMNDVYDNQLVHGGKTPLELLRICQGARRVLVERRKRERERDDEA